jgi:wyosine [tRNA(Phe)-imidazoG37] synthetase (radical SAM superfamily)
LSTLQNEGYSANIYGPVPSRRLGFSLGIDIIPFKTCSLDCIYCQLGPTTKKTVRRSEYYALEKILFQIREALSSEQRIDYITFSGSGEPTLNTIIGKLIKEIKKITSVPVAVLTNSTLLTQKSVRKALQSANLVVPSLDAATQERFIKINQPHPSLRIKNVVDGLKEFRKEFKGQIWLEIMLVKDYNDSLAHIKKLKQIISEVQPDKVQLNTVIRPPTQKFAHPLSLEELKKIKNLFGKNCEIIAEFRKKRQLPSSVNIENAILSMIQRRPVTLVDISRSLGRHKNEIIKHLNSLLRKGKIRLIRHKRLTYYEPK